MITRTTMFTVGSLLVAALAATGCSSSDSTTGTTGDADASTTGATDSGSTAKDTGAVPAADTGAQSADAGPTGDGICAADVDASTCQDCCVANHSNGNDVLNNAVITCACKPGFCDTICKTSLCATPQAQPDQDCISCVQGTVGADAGAKSCVSDARTACASDTDCTALLTCLQQCN